jgi:hypothetical protein
MMAVVLLGFTVSAVTSLIWICIGQTFWEGFWAGFCAMMAIVWLLDLWIYRGV